MDYEKKYKELESKIRKAYLYAQTDSTKAVFEDILPELKESEDERIRKALITYFQRFPYPYGGIESAGTNAKEALSWLEKKCEKKEIEFNPDDIIDESYQQQADDLIDMFTEKPACSEEDEVRINRIVSYLKNLNVADNDILLKDVDWLESFKQRI